MDERLEPEGFWERFREALDNVDPKASQPPPESRAAAVMVLLEDTDEGPRLVLTRRRRDLRSHPGQVSFPGGRIDPGETIEEAAVREAEEEIGLDADSIEILGAGPTFYIPPSRFWMVPVVARWTTPHELRPNPWEVDEILHVTLVHLLDRENWRHVPLSLRGSSWAWELADDLLWGATAIVTALMLDVVVPGWSEGLAPDDLDEEQAVRPWEQAPLIVRRARLGDDLPAVPQRSVPHVTVAQMQAIDERLGQVGVGLAQLAEQAAAGVVEAVRRLLDRTLDGADVMVVAGPGGNGAGGLATARLLAGVGAEVTVLLTGGVLLPEQLQPLEAAGVQVLELADEMPELAAGDVVVDAMLGIGADPPLDGRPEVVADWLRRHDVPVISLDLPSGIGGDIGLKGACVTAEVTVTLAAPKIGTSEPIAHAYLGDYYLADLGIPSALWEQVGVEMPSGLFASGPLLRLTAEGTASDAGTPDQGVV